MKSEKRKAGSTGLGRGRPVAAGGPLSEIGDLPDGGILRQTGNACGVCSLSAVFRHYGVETTQREIDREVRNANLFTAPGMLMKYARDSGFDAAFYNRGTVAELKDFIDRGIPVVLLVDTQPHNPYRTGSLHYVTAISYRDSDGFNLGIYNPWGLREEITEDELQLIWSDVRLGPLCCSDSAYIVVAPRGEGLGAGRPAGAKGTSMLGTGIMNAVNGLTHVARDRQFLKGFREIALAIPQTFAGLSLFIYEQVEQFVSARRADAGSA